jgi:hypothetical protein
MMFDCELMFHGFANYMLDYQLNVLQSVDPRSGLAPRHLHFVVRICTEGDVRSTEDSNLWARSTGDQLLETHSVSLDSPGYVWGVRCQHLYSGGDDHRGLTTSPGLGGPTANANPIPLVFADLSVEEVSAGPVICPSSPPRRCSSCSRRSSCCPASTLLNVPIDAQEQMVLAVRLLQKGFTARAPPLATARPPSVRDTIRCRSPCRRFLP